MSCGRDFVLLNEVLHYMYSFGLQNRQYKYYSTGLLSAVDLYENPYSCNIKEEAEDENKLQAKKRKYIKTGKYKKTLDQSKESTENNEDAVSRLCLCDSGIIILSTLLICKLFYRMPPPKLN